MVKYSPCPRGESRGITLRRYAAKSLPFGCCVAHLSSYHVDNASPAYVKLRFPKWSSQGLSCWAASGLLGNPVDAGSPCVRLPTCYPPLCKSDWRTSHHGHPRCDDGPSFSMTTGAHQIATISGSLGPIWRIRAQRPAPITFLGRPGPVSAYTHRGSRGPPGNRKKYAFVAGSQ